MDNVVIPAGWEVARVGVEGHDGRYAATSVLRRNPMLNSTTNYVQGSSMNDVNVDEYGFLTTWSAAADAAVEDAAAQVRVMVNGHG